MIMTVWMMMVGRIFTTEVGLRGHFDNYNRANIMYGPGSQFWTFSVLVRLQNFRKDLTTAKLNNMVSSSVS